MSKDPAVLFYTSDWLSGVAFMSMEDRGKYMTLLCEQHQSGHIPENHMISVCGSVDSLVIKKFVKDEQGLWYNVRMDEEKKKRIKFCESRSNNKSGRPKKESHDNHTKNHMPVHMENENDNGIVLNTTEVNTKRRNFATIRDAGPTSWMNDDYRGGLEWERVLASDPNVDIERVISGAAAYKVYCESLGLSGQYVSRVNNWLANGEWKTDWVAKEKEQRNKKPKTGTNVFGKGAKMGTNVFGGQDEDGRLL